MAWGCRMCCRMLDPPPHSGVSRILSFGVGVFLRQFSGGPENVDRPFLRGKFSAFSAFSAPFSGVEKRIRVGKPGVRTRETCPFWGV